jgi:hypothetical protein
MNKGLINETPSAYVAQCSLLRMKNEGVARGQSVSCLANEQLTMEDDSSRACLTLFTVHCSLFICIAHFSFVWG